MAKTILIVDDEQDLCDILRFNLTRAGYRCLIANNGKDALRVVSKEHINLIFLDIMMPGMSGLEVAKHITNTPIIFLSALGDENNKLTAFGLGADDYITKPFSIGEVLARTEAVLRRMQEVASIETGIEKEGLVIEEGMKIATLDGRTLSLTKIEYELLRFLFHHPNTLYRREELLSQVWPNDGMVLERTVDVTINRLRKKLGNYREMLKSKAGYGYYWGN